MAAPSYLHDLTDITLAESTSDFDALGGGGAGLGTGADFSMQGSLCVDKQITNANKGMMYDNSTGITMGADDHAFVWLFCATPGLTDTRANEGTVIAIGTSTNNYNAFHVDGNDTYGALGRVGRCYPIRYITSANGSEPYRTNYGSPGANPRHFGGKLNTTSSVKGANLGIDAIRYGSGAFITAGEGGDPATFLGFSAQNDSLTNRWGILTNAGGTFELQGKFVIGRNTSGTPTAAHFVDANVSISIVDTIHSSADFSQFVIDHASTVFAWTNVVVTGLGTNNPGQLNFTDVAYSTPPELNGGSFTDFGVSVLQAEVEVVGTTWRNSDLVTQNGASIIGATFEASTNTSTLLVDDLDNITDTDFVSDGTGHGLEYAPVGAGPFVVAWDGNQDTGFAGSDGSTGNETILIHPTTNGADITINVINGGSFPTVMEHGDYTGTVLVLNSVATTIAGVPTGAEWRLYEDSGVSGELGTTELAGAESKADGSDISYLDNYSSDTDVVLQVINSGSEEFLLYFTLTALPQTQTVVLQQETNT